MSEIAIGRPRPSGEAGRSASDGPFNPLIVALMLAVGVLGFIGTFVLGAYAPDLGSGRNGGAHALSNAATGYSGLVQLAEATGRHPRVVRDPAMLATEDLVVLTPERGAVDMSKALAARQGKPTLLVLPKWATVEDRDRRGWVRVAALLGELEPEGVLAPATKLDVARRRSGGRPLRSVDYAPAAMRFQAPRPLQTVSGAQLEPLIVDEDDRIVLGKLPDAPLYILADPDLLANHAMADLAHANAALALLDFLNSNDPEGVAFDVTLNGLGRGRNALRLFFEPPFLAMTLAIAVALLLAGWQAVTRFGAAAPPERAIAFGKRALLDNTAALVRKARREAALGRRYADAIRGRARDLFGVPAALGPEQADAYLDRLNNGERFSDMAAKVADARDRDELLAAARALHGWMGDRIK